MTQHINLLPPSGESARDAVTLPNVLWATLAALALAALASAWWRPEVARLGREIASLKQQAAAREAVKGRPAATIDAALARRLDEARARSALLLQAESRLGDLDATVPEKFSIFFDALSRQTMPGVWLTAFSADGPNRRIVMAGRALSPELVPGYLQRLQREPAFQSRRFASLELEDRTPAGGPPRAESAAAPAGDGVRVVDFRLQSDTSQGPGRATRGSGS